MRSVFSYALLAALALPAIPAAAQSDTDVAAAKRISTHLQESGQLRNYRIGVSYASGVATLNGTVTSAEQRDAAIRLAKSAPGVTRVICQLQCPEAPNAGQPRGIAGSLGEAQLASAQGGPPQVQHAFTPPQARSPRPARPANMRGNMPLPTPRNGVSAMGPRNFPVRQTAGSCPDGSCGPAGPAMMGGGAMYGPEMGAGCANGGGGGGMGMGGPAPMGFVPQGYGSGPNYETAQMPGYAWPSYASYPNYAALTYPKQYSPTAWPYIGPFYPYPQVPLAWRKVSLEWDDGWWFLDFSAHNSSH